MFYPYAKHKPGFPKLPTLLVTKVRPSDEALRGKLLRLITLL